MSVTIIVLAGTINRGKKTLLNKFEFAIKEFAQELNELEKNCQGNIPAQTIIAYGTPASEGNFPSLLKTIVKTTMEISGCKMLHKIPITVCLYRTKISRQAKK